MKNVLLIGATVLTLSSGVSAKNVASVQNIEEYTKDRIKTLCADPMVMKHVINPNELCEVSTDGGVTWKTVSAIALGALALAGGATFMIRRRKKSQNDTEDYLEPSIHWVSDSPMDDDSLTLDPSIIILDEHTSDARVVWNEEDISRLKIDGVDFDLSESNYSIPQLLAAKEIPMRLAGTEVSVPTGILGLEYVPKGKKPTRPTMGSSKPIILGYTKQGLLNQSEPTYALKPTGLVSQNGYIQETADVPFQVKNLLELSSVQEILKRTSEE